MTEAQFSAVRSRVESLIVGLNVKDTLVVLLSVASSTAAMLLKMSRADFLEMCGEFYDKRSAELATRRRLQ